VKHEKVFLYEYATCGSLHEVPAAMAIEGLGMFKALLRGFEACCRVNTFIDPSLALFPGYPRAGYSPEAFEERLAESDYALLIAPESSFELYRLTKTLEKSGCSNLGSSSRAVRATTDKYETYKKIRHLSPRTEVFKGSTGLSFPLVAKPRDGVSGEGIFLVSGEDDLAKVPRGYLLQEYVEGMAMSAGFLVGDEIKLLSINTQELRNFSYYGSRLPVEGINPEPLFRALEKIRGLHGYVGVDFVLGEELKVIEINPRPTTPIVAFHRAYGINLAELLLRNHLGETLPKPRRRRRVYLQKVARRVANSYISFKEYSLLLRDLDAGTDLGHRGSQR
jgi:hypothetical protein